jgi:hypothetical protein
MGIGLNGLRIISNGEGFVVSSVEPLGCISCE